jgi:ribosomal protein L34E
MCDNLIEVCLQCGKALGGLPSFRPCGNPSSCGGTKDSNFTNGHVCYPCMAANVARLPHGPKK